MGYTINKVTSCLFFGPSIFCCSHFVFEPADDQWSYTSLPHSQWNTLVSLSRLT